MMVLGQCFSLGVILPPPEIFCNIWRYFLLSCLGEEITAGIDWEGARGVAKHPTKHRTAPHPPANKNKEVSSPHVSSQLRNPTLSSHLSNSSKFPPSLPLFLSLPSSLFLTLIETLVYVRHCSKHFLCIN